MSIFNVIIIVSILVIIILQVICFNNLNVTNNKLDIVALNTNFKDINVSGNITTKDISSTGDISCDKALYADTIISKTSDTVTINDNVVINGSLKYTRPYCDFYAHDVGELVTTDNRSSIPLIASHFNSGHFTINATTNEITILSDMIANVTYNVTFAINNGPATTVWVSIEVNNSDRYDSVSHVQLAAYPSRSSGSATCILDLRKNDVVRLRYQRNIGTTPFNSHNLGCNLTIVGM